MSYVLEGFKWGGASYGTPSGTITYAIDWTGLQYDDSLYDLADFETALGDAVQQWEDAAAIKFSMTGDISSADIAITFVDLSGDTVGLAETYYTPGFGNNPGIVDSATIQLDSTETWDPYGTYDLNFLAVAMHEIGHTLGLDHTTDDGQIMYPFVTDMDTLGTGDIYAVQYIYGVDGGDVPVEDPGADPGGGPGGGGGGGDGAGAGGGLIAIVLGLVLALLSGIGGAGAAVVAAMTAGGKGDDDDTSNDHAADGHNAAAEALVDLVDVVPITHMIEEESAVATHELYLEEAEKLFDEDLGSLI